MPLVLGSAESHEQSLLRVPKHRDRALPPNEYRLIPRFRCDVDQQQLGFGLALWKFLLVTPLRAEYCSIAKGFFRL